jgi:succinoglycan biosynthesis transport protein ExoP
MAMNVDQGFQLDLVGALRRRGMLIAGVAGMIFLVGYWVAMALPNEYRAYSTLLVEPQAVSGTLVNSDGGGADLNDRLHLMTAQILSRPRLSSIIDDLDLYQDESTHMTRQEVIDLMRSQVLVVPILPELEAAMRRREIEINTFRVEFVAGSARVAADVAQHLANDFIEEHIGARVEVSQKSLDFIVAEQSRIAGQIEEVEAKIAGVKDSNPGSLPEDMMQNQRLIERSLSSLRIAQRELDTARSDAGFWASQAADAAAGGGGGMSDVSPGRRLQQLELLLDSLRARGFTDKHPDIIIALQEVSEVKESIRIMGDSQGSESDPVNIGQRNALAQERRANNRVTASKAEIARHQEEIDQLTAQIEATPRVAEKLEALFRQHKNLSGNMSDFNDRRLEAEVRADLERRQLGEQFRVLEPAFPPTEPASPNRILILIVGLMIGSSLGVAAAIVAESADSSVHGPLQLQTDMGIPVLASIPTILLQPDLVARRRRWVRNLAAAAGITIFMLVGGFVTYLAVNGAGAAADAAEVDRDAQKRSLDLLREPGSGRGGAGSKEPGA